MLSFQQRRVLEDLSLKIFKNKFEYQRLQRKFKMADSTVEVEEVNYLQLQNGQIVRPETAIAMGKAPRGTPLKRKVLKQVRRSATFEELKYALESTLEAKELSEMSEAEKSLNTAVKMQKAELLNQPFLVVGENDQKEFEELLAQVSVEHQRDALKSRVVPNSNKDMFCLPGVQFLSDFVWVQEDKEAAEKHLADLAKIREFDAMNKGFRASNAR